MNNLQHDLYYDPTAARSPGGQQRHPQPSLHRQSSRQFDGYGPIPHGSAYAPDEPGLARFETNRFDRMNTAFQNGAAAATGYPGFDLAGGSQTWNPAAFAAPNTFNTFSPMGNSTNNRMKPATTRGRANLPQTWMDSAPTAPLGNLNGLNGLNGFGSVGPSLLDTQSMRPPQHHPYMAPGEVDDELIPTAIVIKNIPFAVKKEQLVEVMTELNLPLPYAFNYHFDNGVFRGLAFANFTSPEETATVIAALNHYELQGRKLRVEYKKMLPLQERERIEREKRERRGQLEEQHRPMAPPQPGLQTQHSMSSIGSHVPATSPSPVSARNTKLDVDLNDPQNLQFYNQLFSFKEDTGREALIFPSTLAPQQRRVVHTLAHHLNLQHISRGAGDQRQVHVVKSPPGSGISPPLPPGASFHLDSSRRVLNRAATTDFSESRGGEHLPSGGPQYGGMRPGPAGLHLGIPDSPGGFQNRAELRAAKSHADLRSYTPSPVPSSASFPAALQSNIARFQDAHAAAAVAAAGGLPASSVAGATPTLTPAASAGALSGSGSGGAGGHDSETLINGIASMGIGSGFAPNGGSPRRLRGMFSWENSTAAAAAPPHTAPIGSNRGFGGAVGFGDSGARGVGVAVGGGGQGMPIRQPAGPAERGAGFVRGRPNGHQARSSDDMRHSQPEIIVE